MARYSHKGHDTIQYDITQNIAIRYDMILKCFTVCKKYHVVSYKLQLYTDAHTAASRQQRTTLEHRRSAYQHCRWCRWLDTGRPVRRRSAGGRCLWSPGSFSRATVSTGRQTIAAVETLHSCYCLAAARHGRWVVARLKYLVIAQSLNIWAVRPPSQSTHRPSHRPGNYCQLVSLCLLPPRCTRLPLSMSPTAFTQLRVVRNIDFVWGVIIAIKICHDTTSISWYSIRYDISCHH